MAGNGIGGLGDGSAAALLFVRGGVAIVTWGHFCSALCVRVLAVVISKGGLRLRKKRGGRFAIALSRDSDGETKNIKVTEIQIHHGLGRTSATEPA